MNSAIVPIVIAGAVIAVIGTTVFALIVINIQIVDRSKQLTQEPRTVLDALTRRVLGAYKHSSRLRQTKES